MKFAIQKEILLIKTLKNNQFNNITIAFKNYNKNMHQLENIILMKINNKNQFRILKIMDLRIYLLEIKKIVLIFHKH